MREDSAAQSSTMTALESIHFVAIPGTVEPTSGAYASWREAVHSTMPLLDRAFPVDIHQDDLSSGVPRSVFMVQVDEPPTSSGRQKHPDFYANVGNAIRTLREDIPLLFAKDLDCK